MNKTNQALPRINAVHFTRIGIHDQRDPLLGGTLFIYRTEQRGNELRMDTVDSDGNQVSIALEFGFVPQVAGSVGKIFTVSNVRVVLALERDPEPYVRVLLGQHVQHGLGFHLK